MAQQVETIQQRLLQQQQAVQQAQDRLAQARQQLQERQALLADLTESYQLRHRQAGPTSRLAQACRRWQAAERRCQSREQAVLLAQRRLTKRQRQWAEQHQQLECLQQRLARFERDNETNLTPIEAEFRLDAGFGTYENIALLIEMGYHLYTKAHNHQVVTCLKDKTEPQTRWSRVGANAEMTAWPALSFKHCPYPLDVGLERFYTGQKLKYSALLHFGDDPVTQTLPEWFKHYNGRQTIEAGIKEGKRVFRLHRIKVRSEPAIFLQQAMVIFAANFIRWASHCLSSQTPPDPNSLQVSRIGIKRLVQVGAHVSAKVIQEPQGKLLKFSKQTVFAGKVLKLPKLEHSPPFT